MSSVVNVFDGVPRKVLEVMAARRDARAERYTYNKPQLPNTNEILLGIGLSHDEISELFGKFDYDKGLVKAMSRAVDGIPSRFNYRDFDYIATAVQLIGPDATREALIKYKMSPLEVATEAAYQARELLERPEDSVQLAYDMAKTSKRRLSVQDLEYVATAISLIGPNLTREALTNHKMTPLQLVTEAAFQARDLSDRIDNLPDKIEHAAPNRNGEVTQSLDSYRKERFASQGAVNQKRRDAAREEQRIGRHAKIKEDEELLGIGSYRGTQERRYVHIHRTSTTTGTPRRIKVDVYRPGHPSKGQVAEDVEIEMRQPQDLIKVGGTLYNRQVVRAANEIADGLISAMHILPSVKSAQYVRAIADVVLYAGGKKARELLFTPGANPFQLARKLETEVNAWNELPRPNSIGDILSTVPFNSVKGLVYRIGRKPYLFTL